MNESRQEHAWRQTYERNMALGAVMNAREILLARLRAAPSDIDAITLLCRDYQESGEPLLAENLLREYLTHNPRHISAQTFLARILWRSGRRDEALALMHDSIQAGPRSDTLWNTLVEWYGQSQRYDEAIVWGRKWLAAIPESGRAQFRLADLLISQGLYEPALKHLKRVVNDPELAIDAGLVVARTRLRMNELESALDQTYRSLAESARFLPRHVNLVVVLAQQWHAKGQFQAVVACCEAIQAENTDDPLVLALYASSLQRLGRMADSEHGLTRFSEIFRHGRGTRVNRPRLASALWLLERYDEALAELRESLRTVPNSEANWQLLVRWLEQIKREQDAIDAAQSWIAAAPESGQANWNLARLMVGKGCYGEARELIERALSATTVAPDQGFEIVWAYMSRREVGLATRLMEKLVASRERIMFRHTASIMKLAKRFHAEGQYSAAENSCQAIAELRGDDPAFLALYGNVLLSNGDVELAKEILARSVFLAPGSDNAPRLLLALSHIHHGSAELGRAYLSEATGFQEEGKVFVELFGNAAPLIPYFGVEIDRSLVPF